MTAVEVLRLPLDTDLSGFVGLLQRLNVPHRVAEEGGEQVLWVPGEALAEQVRELYVRHPQGYAGGEVPASAAPVRDSFFTQLRRSPVTALVLLATFIVFAVTLAGENFSTIRWLSFVDFRIDGERIYLTYLDATLGSGQWWRLITPMLIHFGWLHLAMNSLWYWELGGASNFARGPSACSG